MYISAAALMLVALPMPSLTAVTWHAGDDSEDDTHWARLYATKNYDGYDGDDDYVQYRDGCVDGYCGDYKEEHQYYKEDFDYEGDHGYDSDHKDYGYTRTSSTYIDDGAMIKTRYSPDVYIVKYSGGSRYKRLILSPSVFTSYQHLRWEDIMTVSTSTFNSFTTSNYVRAKGDCHIWKLYPYGDQGMRRLASDCEDPDDDGIDDDSIYTINRFDLNSYKYDWRDCD